MPANVVLIDTPGFNANQARSEIAADVIRKSHVCIFVIDARNALKAKEIQVLRSIKEEVGKTFLVLNKMDLVLGDDELDCDGADSANETIKRVADNVAKEMKTDKVVLYPVSSLPKEQVVNEAKAYAENVDVFMEKVLSEAENNKLELIVHSFAKKAIQLAEEVLLIIAEVIRSQQKEQATVYAEIPQEITLFSEELMDNLSACHVECQTRYMNAMEVFVDDSFSIANDNFKQWLRNIGSVEDLKNGVKQKAQSLTEEAIARVENKRREELCLVSTQINKEIVNFFEKLYQELPFNVNFSNSELLQTIPKIEGSCNNIEREIQKIKYSGAATGAGMAIGAGIGAIFGPLGIVAGAIIGGAMGSKDLSEVKKEAKNAYYDGIIDIKNSVILALRKDVQDTELASFFHNLSDVIAKQLALYQERIETEIAHYKLEGLYLQRILIHLEKIAIQIEDRAKGLGEWKASRTYSI